MEVDEANTLPKTQNITANTSVSVIVLSPADRHTHLAFGSIEIYIFVCFHSLNYSCVCLQLFAYDLLLEEELL